MNKNPIGLGYWSGWPGTSGGWESFNGTIDEAQIWNRSLTASEINELYQSKVVNQTTTTFTGSNCPTAAQGAADFTCNLYRNMSLVSNPDTQTLNSGFYYYIYNTTGGQNYS